MTARADRAAADARSAMIDMGAAIELGYLLTMDSGGAVNSTGLDTESIPVRSSPCRCLDVVLTNKWTCMMPESPMAVAPMLALPSNTLCANATVPARCASHGGAGCVDVVCSLGW